MVEKKCKVRFLPLFEWDLAEITDYISNNLKNPQAAYLLVDSVVNLKTAHEIGMNTILFNRDNEEYDGTTVYSFEELSRIL